MRRLQLTQAMLITCALLGTAAVALAVYRLLPRFGALPAVIVGAAMLWWMRGVFSRRRVALWVEERVPSLRFALASLLDAPDTRFRQTLETRVRESRLARPVAMAAVKLAVIPALVLLGVHFLVAPLLARHAPDLVRAGGGRDPVAPGAAGARNLRYSITTTPPAYTRRGWMSARNPSIVIALVGSRLDVSGDVTLRTTMGSEPRILRLEKDGAIRMVSLEPTFDSAPQVVLELPATDTVLRSPAGALRLAAQTRDEIGVRTAWFEIIVSSGSGEAFTFRSAVLGRADLEGRRDGRIEAVLPLDSLALRPGDVVHLRAVARDDNPARGAEPGTSETRTLRVPRADEGDTTTVEAMPPPEVNRSEMSQRMLIILTERLVGRMRSISAGTLRTESGNIAREQARLRKRVGEIIFTRLTGDEHADEDAAAAMDDTLSPGEALLRAASEATNIEEGHEHEEGGAVLGVNRNLLEAFNAMWDAERRLGQVEPRQALPFMRAALDAIQRARAAERLYLRGRAPRVVLDIAKIRLTGKTDGIAPGTRSPRASALAATLARRARFAAAVDLLGDARTVPAAIDSLMVVRIDVLGESRAIAAALAAAIEDLRAGRDATESLLAAHRQLTGMPAATRQGRWSGL